MTIYKTDAVNSGIMPDFHKAGVLLCRTGTYTATADLESGTFQMVPVPDNCMIVDAMVNISGNASDGAFDLGDGSSSGRFFNGVNCSLTPVSMGMSSGNRGGFAKEYTANDTIDFVPSGSDIASGAVITVHVIYKMLGTLSDEA